MALDAKGLIKRGDELKSARVNWEVQWDEIAHFCLPRSEQFRARRVTGQRLPTDVFDSTARQAVRTMAAGFMGQLTNPATLWFDLATQDEALMEVDAVRIWLDEARRAIANVFLASNFYGELHEFLLDLAAFGTACFYSEEDPFDLVRYYARNVREIAFAEDARGRAEEIHRFFTLTAVQAYGRWKAAAGKEVVEMMAKRQYDHLVNFRHCVGPRALYASSKGDALNKPWYSAWLNAEESLIIREGGFEELPFHIARFSKVTHENYGYAPSMDVLPDIKSANSIMKTLLRGGAKIVDPPIEIPDNGYLLPLDLNAGQVNIRKASIGKDDGLRPIQTGGNLPVGIELLREERAIINSAYFVDLFQMLAQRQEEMTAREVLERVAEKTTLLGPVVGRLSQELLDPVIVRTFHILLRNGKIAPPPPELRNVPYAIEYVSQIAKAMKASEVGALQQFLTVVEAVGQINGEALDNVDTDVVVRDTGDLLGVSPKIMRAPEEIAARRKARADAAAQQTQLALIAQGAKAASDAGSAAHGFARAREVGGGAPVIPAPAAA